MNNPKQEKVLEVLNKAFAVFNEQLPADRRLNGLRDCKIVGSPNLDSAEIVNVLVAVEQQVEQDLGVSVTLFDEIDRFVNVGVLSDYIADKI